MRTITLDPKTAWLRLSAARMKMKGKPNGKILHFLIVCSDEENQFVESHKFDTFPEAKAAYEKLTKSDLEIELGAFTPEEKREHGI